MKAILKNEKLRPPLVLGATLGIGHALFRGLTENLGSLVGMAVFVPVIAAIALGMHLLLNAVAKAAQGTESENAG